MKLPSATAEPAADELSLIAGEGEWELPDASFDVVWAGETIEHVADTAGWLSEVRRVLRPGGHLLLSTPGSRAAATAVLGAVAARVRARTSTRAPITCASTRAPLAARLLADFRFERGRGPRRAAARRPRARVLLARGGQRRASDAAAGGRC